jgi:NAD+ kinase
MAEIKRALLFVNSHKAEAPALADEVARELTRLGIAAVPWPFGGESGVPMGLVPRLPPDIDIEKGFDLAFSLGGDGTVLYVARTIAPYGVPVFPINIGTLGFIAVVHPGEWRSVFEQWRRGAVGVSRRLMLEVSVERQGKTIARLSCMNDAVISASGIAKIIRLQVASDTKSSPDAGRQYMRLGNYRSDGLIVATPTGSTAYSVAAGGPILDPEIEALIINPICPFTLSNRPIVVPAGETVIVEVEAEQRSGVLLTVDGQVTEPLEPNDRVFIRKADYEARLIASGREGFYKALQTKLNWSGGSPHA